MCYHPFNTNENLMAHAGLIIGLGNPGNQYQKTRHNFGFMAVDYLLEQEPECTLLSSPNEKDVMLWEWQPEHDVRWLVMKPLTFMNRSGRAVQKVLKHREIDPDKILVIHDELDLPLGRMRFKQGGGLAGHNGLRSLAAVLGSRDFHRLRLGIGRPEANQDVVSYVLGRFAPDEVVAVQEICSLTRKALILYCREGIDRAMCETHGVSKG